jgi:hypothetical protein
MGGTMLHGGMGGILLQDAVLNTRSFSRLQLFPGKCSYPPDQEYFGSMVSHFTRDLRSNFIELQVLDHEPVRLGENHGKNSNGGTRVRLELFEPLARTSGLTQSTGLFAAAMQVPRAQIFPQLRNPTGSPTS